MSEPLGDTVLLDTHVWIGLLNGDEALGRSPALRQIERAARSSSIRVSAISVWEVGMLESKGRIHLPMGCWNWVQQALAWPGISLAPLTPESAVESSRLPGEFHGDPADRIIVATARILPATIITRDERILAYGAGNHVAVLPA